LPTVVPLDPVEATEGADVGKDDLDAVVGDGAAAVANATDANERALRMVNFLDFIVVEIIILRCDCDLFGSIVDFMRALS
jgi:hypothetical protein